MNTKTIAVVGIAVVLVGALVFVALTSDQDEAEYKLVTSSDAAMTSALGGALENGEHIVVTLWSPHWAFAEYNTDDYHLVYLDDPEGTFGAAEQIITYGSQDLNTSANKADAKTILSNFNWTDDEIGAVMGYINAEEGQGANAAGAQAWVDNEGASMVSDWKAGITGSDRGVTLKLALVNWACAQASSNVMKIVLEDVGYTVTMHDINANAMYTGLANNDYDFMTTAWLPATHASYIEDHGDSIVQLGVNYEGAKLGLVVANYTAEALGITSITDLRGNGSHFNNEIIGIDAGAGLMKMAADAMVDYELNQPV